MKKTKLIPPRHANKMLLCFLRDDLAEEVMGDLEEKFYSTLERKSLVRARLNYWYEVLHYLRPFAIRKLKSSTHFNNWTMYQHTLLIAYRSFKRYKSSFFINLAGLSTGLACTLLIYLWVSDELSIDKFNANDNHIYQVMQNVPDKATINTGTGTPGLLAKALAEEMPEVEYATATVPASWWADKGILTYNDTHIKSGAQFVSKDYFHIFSTEIVAGNESNVLPDKQSVAISDELAVKLFGSVNHAIGKTIEWNQIQPAEPYHVTAVFKSPPSNATNQYDMLLSYDLFFANRSYLDQWGSSDPNAFVLLRPGTDIDAFNKKIKNFIKTKDKNAGQQLFVQRYSERYLHNHYENGVPSGGRIEYVRLFIIIAFFIIVIACINFMNLTTAKASRRLKEIGIKKAVGATRNALILQYFGESMLMTLFSLITAVLLVFLILPNFNQITGKALTLHWNGNLILSIAGIAFLTGLIAGSHPALYLSKFRPVEVLKGKLPSSLSELWARKGLVVFQFTISIILIVAVLVIYKQTDYIQSKNLGYNRDNIVHFELEIKNDPDENYLAEGGKFEKHVETFMNEAKNIPGVIRVANFEHDMMGRHGGLGGIDWEDGDKDDKMQFSNMEAGYDFIEALGIEMAEGRSFSRNFNNERSKVIFNETAIKQMGIKDPIGKTLRLWGKEKQIIGVAKDFHYESLYEEVKPIVFQLEPRSYRIMVKIKGGSEREAIAQLQKLYESENTGLAMDYTFLDDDYQALYVSEQRVAILSRYFAAIAIMISCLGLFALAAFTSERRMKEIGIRKILGSSEWGVVYLLASDFTKMVLTAVVIALPISYYLTKTWLQDFAYRITLQWWYFIGAGLAALCIAWITVGIQAIKAARVNPVNSLKSE